MRNDLKLDSFRAGIIYFLLICGTYSPIVFYNRTLSMAARYPWLGDFPSEEIQLLPKNYPNTFNVDMAHPAAYEECLDRFIGNQIRRGSFPLWNPFLACGSTTVEQFSTRLFFPYQILQNICPWSWQDFFLLGRIFLAAMGTFFFLRLLGIGFYSSLCGGIMYGFSGAMVVFLTLTEMSNVGMVLPYTFLGVELLSRRCNIINLAFCSLGIVFLILGDQPEVYFYCLIFISFYYLFRVITDKESKAHLIKKIYFFLFATVIALLIASPFFIPFLINSKHYYYLHLPGGTMGIQTPTPLANLMAIFLPELLRWRSVVYAFTWNAGWDFVGGYIGISAIFIIIISFKKKWWRRKEYLFFLCFGIFILLKNIGVPIVSWVGRLPLFDQVWTPRWTGPVWNFSLTLSAALGLEALFLVREGEVNTGDFKNKSYSPWLLMLIGIVILSLGVLINPALLIILKDSKQISFSAITMLRLFLVAIGSIILFKAARYLNFSRLFLIFCLGIVICIFNFQAQLLHIDIPFKNFLEVGDKLVLFSMWQGMMESTLLGLFVILALCNTLRQKGLNIDRFAFILSAIIIIEMSFHTTVGYDEIGRLFSLIWHLVALVCMILYSLFPKKEFSSVKILIGLCLFLGGMIALGIFGVRCMPKREEVFKYPFINLNYDGVSRIMGIKGLTFPNISAALGIHDIKSIVSVSIKRFQLFQDYCLLAKPQEKYKSLWFTGIVDPETGKDISEHIRERYPFYALAGITNYLSPDYEDIPNTKLIQDGPVKNYQNLAVMPRAFVVHRWFSAKTPEQSLDWMLSHYSSFDSEAVVEETEIPSIPEFQEKPFTEVKIRSYNLHSVIIDAETNASGLLILTDTFHPDWRVFVNGKKERIFPVNLCFRGVFLSPGKHEVKFIYFPKTFYICCAVSLITLLVLLSILVLKNAQNIFRTKDNSDFI